MTQLLNLTLAAAISPATVGPTLICAGGPPRSIAAQAVFTQVSGGTSADAYLQTSIDGGTTWVDIANFTFLTTSKSRFINLSSLTPITTLATPGDGALSSDTVKDGFLGDRFRVKYKSSGTYVGSTLTVDIQVNGMERR